MGQISNFLGLRDFLTTQKKFKTILKLTKLYQNHPLDVFDINFKRLSLKVIRGQNFRKRSNLELHFKEGKLYIKMTLKRSAVSKGLS